MLTKMQYTVSHTHLISSNDVSDWNILVILGVKNEWLVCWFHQTIFIASSREENGSTELENFFVILPSLYHGY